MFIVGQIKCSWLIPHEQAICFSSLIWLSRNKSVKKSRFSRMVKNSREFSLLDLDLEAFWFHFSLLEKEWKHFDFTLHFSKKSESIFFSLCTSRKRVKAFYFHFSLLELQKPTLAGPWQISHRTPPFWTLNDALLAAAFGKLCMVSRFIHWIISLTRVYRLCLNFTELDVCFNFV